MSFILAYIDIYGRRDEIIELVGADEMPTVGGTVTFTSGEHEGSWHICGIKQVDDEIHDALIFLDDKE